MNNPPFQNSFLLGSSTSLPSPNKAMTFAQDRILFTLSWIGSIAGSYSGIVVSQAEQRWFFVTLTAAFATSGILTLGLKGDDETIRVIVGRAGVALLIGIFATYPVVNYFNMESAHTSLVSLGGIACLVTAAGFVFGYTGLQILMNRRAKLAERLLKKYLPITNSKPEP